MLYQQSSSFQLLRDQLSARAAEMRALWNAAQSQFEFYRLGEAALAHFWATLITLLEARQGISSPGLARLREALAIPELSPILTPVVIS